MRRTVSTQITPTWKPGDIFYRLLDWEMTGGKPRIVQARVEDVWLQYTIMRWGSKGVRDMVSHESFSQQYSKTKAAAVGKKIDDLVAQAKRHSTQAENCLKEASFYRPLYDQHKKNGE